MGIKSINKLASILKIPTDYITDICARSQTLYHPYKKPKKNGGGFRTIDNPSTELKAVQKKIERLILKPLVDTLPGCMHGGRRGRSVATNAKPHISSECLLSLDLSDCFGSISYSMVYNFYTQTFSCPPPIAKILTKLTTYRNHLPQGGVTSPSLCNLILAPLIIDLENHAREHNLVLTNYIDDIFVSGNHAELKDVLPGLLCAIKKSSFSINTKKLKLITKNHPMQVTGTTINKKLSVGRKRIRNIEREIMKLDSTSNGERSGDKVGPLDRVNGLILYAYSINPAQGKHLEQRMNCKLKKLNLY